MYVWAFLGGINAIIKIMYRIFENHSIIYCHFVVGNELDAPEPIPNSYPQVPELAGFFCKARIDNNEFACVMVDT
jgi:hypothetical protein